MKLPARNDKGEILKVYESNILRIKWKTVKNFVSIVDLDSLENLDNDMEIGKMVLKAIDPLEEVIRGIFPQLTEMENVDVLQDLVPLAKELFLYVTGKIEELPKN